MLKASADATYNLSEVHPQWRLQRMAERFGCVTLRSSVERSPKWVVHEADETVDRSWWRCRDGDTTEIGGGDGDGGGEEDDGGGGGDDGRGGRAIGRNLERATEVAEMETTAGVGERRQLARVYTTALCSRRPHRAVSSEKNVSICSDTSLDLSLSLSLSLSFRLPFSHSCSVLAKTTSTLPPPTLSPHTHIAVFLFSRILFTFFRLRLWPQLVINAVW